MSATFFEWLKGKANTGKHVIKSNTWRNIDEGCLKTYLLQILFFKITNVSVIKILLLGKKCLCFLRFKWCLVDKL